MLRCRRCKTTKDVDAEAVVPGSSPALSPAKLQKWKSTDARGNIFVRYDGTWGSGFYPAALSPNLPPYDVPDQIV